jgi:hypothetical protein
MAEARGPDPVRPDGRRVSGLQEHDLVGFGSGPIARAITPPSSSSPGRRVSGTTAGFPSLVVIPHRPLRAAPKARKISITGELCLPGCDTFAIFGLAGGINRGRPGDRELERAREFGRLMTPDQGADALS